MPISEFSLHRPAARLGSTMSALQRAACGWLLAIVLLAAPGDAAAQEIKPDRAGQVVPLRPINIGFVQHAYGTWTAKIADGGFELATGRTMRWLPYDADSAVASALASGGIDIGLMGTSVVAAAIARGLDLKVFYVLGGPPDSEGLVLGADITFRFGDMKTLQSKVIAVPFGSTPHFRLLQSLRRWGVALSAMRIVNLQAGQIADAWKRGDIDAAAVSQPMLGRLSGQGYLVPLPVSGGQTSVLVFAAAGEFYVQHMVFLSRLVDVMSRADSAFASMSGPLTVDRADVRSIAFVTGLDPADVIASIARYRPPPLEEQATPSWLGGGALSGLAAELKANAEVWRWGGRLTGTEPNYPAAMAPEPVQMAISYQR